MTGYIIRRILQAIVTLFIVSVITFGLLQLSPGGVVRGMLGNHYNKVLAAQLTHNMGLDRPLPVQYWKWLDGMFHGNFGYDYTNSQTVGSEITGTLGQSAYIIGLALVLTFLLSIPIGIVQARRRNTFVDHTITTVTFILWGVPTFLIGVILLDVFVDRLGWLQPSNEIASFHDAFTQPEAILLPVAALVLTGLGSYTRYMRSSILDEITQDYVRTAVAKGMSQRRVFYGHVLRNSLIPMVTLVGLSLPTLVGGAFIIERVFNINGIGLLTTNAALGNNISVTLAVTTLTALLTVVGSLLADLSYAALDPRVRL